METTDNATGNKRNQKKKQFLDREYEWEALKQWDRRMKRGVQSS